MDTRQIEAHHPAKLIRVSAKTMEEAELIVGATGPQKKAYTIEHTHRRAVNSLTPDDALLVTALAPAVVDSIVAASKGLLDVNVKARCFDETCCSGLAGCCVLL